MTDYDLLKSIFDLAHQGIYANIDNLPSNISKDVVQKNIMYIELQNLKKSNGDTQRIIELHDILYPETSDNTGGI